MPKASGLLQNMYHKFQTKAATFSFLMLLLAYKPMWLFHEIFWLHVLAVYHFHHSSLSAFIQPAIWFYHIKMALVGGIDLIMFSAVQIEKKEKLVSTFKHNVE